MTNPLLQEWITPFELAPFDRIRDTDFEPALEVALKQEMDELLAIANNPDAPTFENTIDAMMAAGKALGQVLSVFYTLVGSDSNPKREALMREFSPKLSAHSSAITSNKQLFARIKTLWDSKDTLTLTPEQDRVLMLCYRNAVRAGSALDGAQETRLKEIKLRLAVLGTEFTQNLLADERDWYMALDKAAMQGLPDFLIKSARSAGKEKSMDMPIITLSRSIVVPFLQFSPRRDLREIVQKAWAARGANDGERDNRPLAQEMLALRQEMSELLGYANFAEFALETEMAKTPSNVRDLLMDVWKPARERAMQDQEILMEYMQKEGLNGALQPWDWRYFSEKRRQQEFDLDESEIKPYFQLDKMIAAAFDCANRLFDLDFSEVNLPLYHQDCRAWEVTRHGKHIALFIGDYFARESKRSGAWCSAMRSQSKFPQEQRPIVINVCNFAKSDPALLSLDDARTLFHEFGHALHQMLSDVTYEMVSGTSVPRDFVELPSQLYEHWLLVPEVLAKFASHAETRKPMPKALMDRVLSAANYDMGFQTVEFVSSALADLEYHLGAPKADIMGWQKDILDDLQMPCAIEMRHATPQFAHVFAGGGYASRYYSYMWSEMMDADAFAAFEEVNNLFEPQLAKSLEDNILSRGGSLDPEELYAAFRGRLPSVDALLRGRELAA